MSNGNDNMNRQAQTTRPRTRGFTIMELMVSIGITIIMLALTGQIFVEATDAVAVGAATSDAFGAARVISEQMDRDARFMVGPGGLPPDADPTTYRYEQGKGGYLVIINRRQEATMLLHRAGEDRRDVRMDQVYWVRESRGEVAMAPEDNATFSNDKGARYMRVGYLQAVRTEVDPATGDQPAGKVFGVGLVGSPDETVDRIVFARQALHLFDDDDDRPAIYAQGVQDDAAVAGTNAPGPQRRLFCGLTDSAYISLDNPSAEAADSSVAGAAGMIVGGDQTETQNNTPVANPDNTAWASLNPNPALSEYKQRILNTTYAQNRLRVNPTPRPYDRNDRTNPYESWRIAQMHSLLSIGVGEVIVEFAADADGDGEIDLDGSDNIRWYSMDDVDADTEAPNWANGRNRLPRYAGGYNPTAENVSGNYANADTVHVFRHDDYIVQPGPQQKFSRWPYMLRVRYRIFDPYGRLAAGGGSDEAGKWFEVILPVNRPE